MRPLISVLCSTLFAFTLWSTALAWTTISLSDEEMAARSAESVPEGAHVWGAFVDEASGAYGRLLVMCVASPDDPGGAAAFSLYLPFTSLEQNDFLVRAKGDGGASTAPFHIEMMPARDLNFGVVRPEGAPRLLEVLLASSEMTLSFEPPRFNPLRFETTGFEIVSADWPCLSEGDSQAPPDGP